MKHQSLIIVTAIAVLCAGAAGLYLRAANGSSATAASAAAFADANAAAQDGDLQTAITSYEELIAGGLHSAAAYYNLASAQQRVGDLGNAVVNYERAAALDPGATDIVANLALVRKEAAASETESTGWSATAASLSINSWTAFAAVALLIPTLFAAASAFGFVRLPRGIRYAGLSVAFLAIGLSIAAVNTLTKDSQQAAIVLNADTPLRVSPFKDAKVKATLPAGRKLQILPDQKHDGYQLAQLSSGEQGWLVSDEEFEIIAHQ